MLIGPKRLHSPVKSWFEAWTHGKPSMFPLILVGDSGYGKSFIVKHFSALFDFDAIESHSNDSRSIQAFRTLFSDARMPTFFGQRRCLIVEDVKDISKSEWNTFDEPMKNQAFPLVLIAQHESEIAWKYRRGALVHRVHQPTVGMIREFLDSFELDIPDEHLDWCSENASTYNNALMLARTTPPDWRGEVGSWSPSRYGHAEIEDILKGRSQEQDFSSHPLALLSVAEFNGCNPKHIIEGMWLHSQAWNVELLSSISRAYLSTLRTGETRKPPYRNRKK
jgi:hypothetical protein